MVKNNNKKRTIVSRQFLSDLQLENIRLRVTGSTSEAIPSEMVLTNIEHADSGQDGSSDMHSVSAHPGLLSSLSDEEEQLLCEITDAMEEYGDLQTRPRLKCISYQMTQRLEPFLAKANKILEYVSTSDLLGSYICSCKSPNIKDTWQPLC